MEVVRVVLILVVEASILSSSSTPLCYLPPFYNFLRTYLTSFSTTSFHRFSTTVLVAYQFFNFAIHRARFVLLRI